MSDLLELRDVSKRYHRGSETINALDRVSLRLAPGEFVAIVGPSGSGKTTLLHLLGCVDCPSQGEVLVEGRGVGRLSDARLTELRRKQFGFIFQQFYLMPTLTALENVELPALFARRNDQVRERAQRLLASVGLSERLYHHPRQLSGGEMQRVAIARALINEPKVLLADEPTGNLDSANARQTIDLLKRLNQEGLAIVVVTHNEELARATARVLHLRDGHFLNAGPAPVGT